MYPMLHQISLILVLIGAFSWGIIGLTGIDFVARIFGIATPVTRAIYIIIGIAAIVLLIV